ncbi:MAG: UvrD-helicase domain-containing protein [Deltaproteobacteria bacterium]|jgi:ATP-dependent exoDNAse (exonuclease V) beta subunit|nr:UvrD-helicase domain-containing protein [Deltaproteobacteria bacterium]
MPALLRLNASAGSGKTYALTRRFLDLLRGASGAGASRGCALICPDRAYTLQEILAATFTNKAASEMKRRLVLALKEEALFQREGWGREAAGRLELILRHYGALNIRTIDSLLSTLARLSALELRLPPDFPLSFEPEEYFTPLYDALMDDLARPEEPQAQFLAVGAQRLAFSLENACRALAAAGKNQSFSSGRQLRESLLELLLRLIKGESLPHADFAALLADLRDLDSALNKAALGLLAAIRKENLEASSLYLKFLRACAAVSPYQTPPEGAQSHKDNLDDCLNKASRGKAGPEALRDFAAFRNAFEAFSQGQLVLLPALRLSPLAELAQELFARLEDSARNGGPVPLARIPCLVRRMLGEGAGAPDALCRLGARLTHLLLDEFQDTSQEQWEALRPLAVECLAGRGSLTYAGDPKQAIYSWRGGEIRLFDQVVLEPELTAIAGPAHSRQLQENWRSQPAIVQHNNAFFSLLSDPEIARQTMAAMLPRHTPPGDLDQAAADCARIFSNARQNLPPGLEEQAKNEGRAGGLVRLYSVSGAGTAAVEQAVRRRLERLFKTELFPARPYSDVAVLTRSGQEATLLASWIAAWNLPVITENSFLLRDHPLVIRLAALLAFLDYPQDDPAFWNFISGPEIFVRRSGLDPQELTDWLARVTAVKPATRPPLFLLFQRDFPRAWEIWLAPFQARAGLMSAYDLLAEAMRRFDPASLAPDQLPFLRRFLEIAHLAEQEGHSSPAAFLAFWETAGGREKLPLPENMNAIRVMTIHKAKGLEFPVVVLPFQHRGRRGEGEIRVALWKGGEILTGAGRHLPEAYYAARITEELERLNLLYVAWTRPAEELHAFITRPDSLAGSLPLAQGLAILLERYAQIFGETLCRRETLDAAKAGETPLPASAAAGGESFPDLGAIPGPEEAPPRRPAAPFPAEASWRPMDWLPRLKIYRSPLAEDVFTPARRGILAHLCLENLLPVGSDPGQDVRRAVRLGLRLFPFALENPAEAARDMRACMDWFAALPQAFSWLSRGRREQSILDEKGALHRVDLLTEDPQGTLLAVDYKTGHAPEEYPLYHAQVRRYMHLLGRAGSLPARGVLVFLDERRLEEVLP